MPWPGHHPGLLRTVEGNLYVLCALAVLVTAALLLTRDHWSRRRQRSMSVDQVEPGVKIGMD
jgi:hypothetical protein